MPLIILTGYPCSGLSYRASQLATLLEAAQDEYFASTSTSSSADTAPPPASRSRYKIHIVPSHDASHPRTLYDHARTEKEARGVAYARAKRVLARDSIVILDGMNYIKGWRYQLWCEAKAAGTTCCVVHVGTPIDQCVANNEARIRRRTKHNGEEGVSGEAAPTVTSDPSAAETPEPELSVRNEISGEDGHGNEEDMEDPYPPELLKNLIFRYEEPSTHSRWDKPLFTVPWTDPTPPAGEIWTALTGLSLQPPATAAGGGTTADSSSTSLLSELASSLRSTSISNNDNASIATARTGATTFTTATTIIGRDGLPRPRIKPHQATVQPTTTDSTTLYAFEKRTSAIITAIRNFTLANPSAEAALAQQQNNTSEETNWGRNEEGISISVPDTTEPIFIPAHVARASTTDDLAGAGGILALPRLQRLRRQWIGLNRAYVGGNYAGITGKGGLRAEQVGDAFVRFLNAEFAGEGGRE